MPKWLIFSLLTIVFWGAWAVLAKPLSKLSPAQSQALSTVGILPLMLVVGLSPRIRQGDRKRRGSLLAFSGGLFVGVGNLAYYAVLDGGTKAAIAVSLTSLYPLATIALALVLLRERPNRIQIVGIGVALAAILLLNLGAVQSGDLIWMGYALAAIVLWGGSAVLMKAATNNVSAELAVFWFLAAFIPLAIVLTVMEQFSWWVAADDWLLVAALGLTYGLGNLTQIAAYRAEGKASIVTPLAGLYPIIAIPLAIFLFGEEITRLQAIGIGLALAGAIALVYEPASSAPPTQKGSGLAAGNSSGANEE